MRSARAWIASETPAVAQHRSRWQVSQSSSGELQVSKKCRCFRKAAVQQPTVLSLSLHRSNGFEQQRFARIANKKAVQELAYKWSVEDM